MREVQSDGSSARRAVNVQLFSAAAPLCMDQLFRRGYLQLAEACNGRSLASASRPRPIKLQHSFSGSVSLQLFVCKDVSCTRRARTLMQTT